jgi:hypothetical protein
VGLNAAEIRVTVIAESGTNDAAVRGTDAPAGDTPGIKAERTELLPPPEPDPGAPCGIEKSRIAALEVPELLTVAWVPGSPVVTVPT